MEDIVITKGLEHCSSNGECKKCPTSRHRGKNGYCVNGLMKDALDLINRLKAKNDCLKAENAELKHENAELRSEISYMKKPNTIGDTHEMGAW